MSKEIDYPYTQAGGAPLIELLQRGQVDQVRKIITGGSGRELLFEASPDEVLLRDTESDIDYWMFAKVDDSRNVTFDLHTRKNGRGFRLLYQPFEIHPDFFANKFVGACINHFEQTGGVNGLRGKWYSKSVNFKQFMDSYEVNQDKVKAALSTWSGKTYSNFGFGNLTKDEIFMHTERANPMIEALFRKK